MFYLILNFWSESHETHVILFFDSLLRSHQTRLVLRLKSCFESLINSHINNIDVKIINRLVRFWCNNKSIPEVMNWILDWIRKMYFLTIDHKLLKIFVATRKQQKRYMMIELGWESLLWKYQISLIYVKPLESYVIWIIKIIKKERFERNLW